MGPHITLSIDNGLIIPQSKVSNISYSVCPALSRVKASVSAPTESRLVITKIKSYFIFFPLKVVVPTSCVAVTPRTALFLQ